MGRGKGERRERRRRRRGKGEVLHDLARDAWRHDGHYLRARRCKISADLCKMLLRSAACVRNSTGVVTLRVRHTARPVARKRKRCEARCTPRRAPPAATACSATRGQISAHQRHRMAHNNVPSASAPAARTSVTHSVRCCTRRAEPAHFYRASAPREGHLFGKLASQQRGTIIMAV